MSSNEPRAASTSFIAIGDLTEGNNNNPPRWEKPLGVGHSVFNGQIVFTNLSAEVVKRLLPTGLRLAPNAKYSDLHPIIHIVGEQTQTGWSLRGESEFTYNDPYQEFILIVPFVIAGGSSQWHNFVVRMYLNSEIAEELGKLFAYRKKVAHVVFDQCHPRRYHVITAEPRSALVEPQDIFKSHDIQRGGLQSDAEAERELPTYREIKKVMAMPVLGVDPRDETRRCCSHFDWTFANVTVTAITTRHSYHAAFNPNVLSGAEQQSADDGAIFIEGLRWTLALPPVPCAPMSVKRRTSKPISHQTQPNMATALAHCAACSKPLPQSAKFCPECGARVAAGAGNGVAVIERSPATAAAVHDRDGDRRQASIMFVDLIGSTELASTMDPEALRTLLRDFRHAIERAVVPYGGEIAQYFGDGILIFFGYPTAREDAAEQAVNAGLEIVRAVRTLARAGVLRVRIGVTTGIVVGGELDAKAFSQGDVAVGGPLWLAARLQDVAPVDGLVISEETHKLTGHLFECRSLGRQSLKGFAEPVAVWLVADQIRASSRFAARNAMRASGPMVGRDAEIAAVLAKWEEVKKTRRAAVTAIVAEAGFGKSRLAQALHARIAADPFVSLQYHCAPHFRNTALYPVIAQLERAAGLERDDLPETKLRKLEALLERSTTPHTLRLSVAYVASLLSVACDESYPALPEAPERKKEGLLAVLQAILVALVEDEPLLILVEDWHWSDPSTQELMKRAIQAVTERPVMFVLTSRVELAQDWSFVQPLVIRLSRLRDEHCGVLIEHLAGGQSLPKHIVDQVLRKAEGVPLYVEEITRGLIESGAGAAPHASEALVSIKPLAVPSTLRDLMQARLDSLSHARDVAQVGSAIGREFSYTLLRTLLPASEAELRGALEALVGADVLQRRGVYPEAQFVFRHALIQDAAYETILLGRRPALHLEIAKGLIESERDVAVTRPEVLAHHFQEGGDMLHASEAFHQAGLRAASRAANVEAGVHFRAAIRALETLPEGQQRYARELAAQVELGLTVTALKGYAAVEVSAIYERARGLCALLGNSAALFPVLRGLCTYYMMRAEFVTALELATECARIGDETQRPDHRIEALAAIGYTLVYLGRLAEGRLRLEEAVEAYRAAPSEFATTLTVRHGVLAAFALIAIVAWMQGEMQYSAQCSHESFALAESTGRPFDHAYAYCFAAMLANLRGDPALAQSNAERGISLAAEHGFNDWFAAGSAQRAIARILLGHASESRDTLEMTATAWQANGAELNRHVFIAGLAAALMATGDLISALKRIDEAVAQSERCNEPWLDAELHRVRGMILEFMADSAGASNAYRRAVKIALGQQARLLALRSSLCLLACDAKAGRMSDAPDIVAAVMASLPADAHQAPEFAAAQAVLAASAPGADAGYAPAK